MRTKNERLAIGVDLGGTNLRIAIVNYEGKIQEQIRVPTDVPSHPEKVASSLITNIKRLQSHLGDRLLEAVGIAVAGQVDAATGNVIFAPNLFWHDVPLASWLAKELKIPIIIANDVRAATWGELYFGAGRGLEDFVCIFIGTGIGGGIVSKGKVMTGHNNSAGEIGHMIIDCNGPICNCGNQGCWEALAAGRAIGIMVREAIQKDPLKGEKILAKAGGDLEKVIASHLFQAAHQGDLFAVSLAKKVEEALIIGTTNLVHILNPECLIFGGGIIESSPWLIEKIEEGVRLKALKSAKEKLKMVKAQCGNDAGVLGAAALALNQGEKNGHKITTS